MADGDYSEEFREAGTTFTLDSARVGFTIDGPIPVENFTVVGGVAMFTGIVQYDPEEAAT